MHRGSRVGCQGLRVRVCGNGKGCEDSGAKARGWVSNLRVVAGRRRSRITDEDMEKSGRRNHKLQAYRKGQTCISGVDD